jgi:hypothetical protein
MSARSWPTQKRLAALRVFLDNSVPVGIRRYLEHHQVSTALNQRWEKLENGELLKVVESSGFDVMITADQNIAYQQNLKERKIALVVLGSNRWTLVRDHIDAIVDAVNAAGLNSYTFIEIPVPDKPAYK